MAIVEGGSGRTHTHTYCDESDGTDSSYWTTCSNRTSSSTVCSNPHTYLDGTTDSLYFLNDSTSIITPGTAVRLTEPRYVIPVAQWAQWSDIDRVDAIRFQRLENESRDPSLIRETERRQAEALQRTQQQAQQRTQQQAVLTQQDLQRAAEQISGMGRMEMGVLQRSRVYGIQREIPHNPAEMYEEACRDAHLGELGEFPAREPEPPVYPEDMIPPRPTPIPSTDYLAHEKKREKAEERAQELLGYMIGEKHLEVYKRTGRLFVKGKKHDYIIQKDGYILQLKENKVIDLCVHLEKKYAMPLTDNVIAMKLSIENEEKKVLKLANKWGEHDRETYALPECARMIQ